MSWANVYLVCFWLGFSLSAVSCLLTVLGLHLPHLPHLHLHGVHAHGHVSPHHASGSHHTAGTAAAPSPLNFSTAGVSSSSS